MKFLIVLALAIVATQAAFTGSLVQQAQPLIRGLKLQSLSRTSVEANFQTQLGQAISESITNTINQIQQAVENVQNVVQILSNSVENAVQQGIAIGQQAVQQAQGLLANLLSNIIGAFSGDKNSRELPPVLIGIIQQLGANDQFLDLVHSTQLYQCLIGKGLQIEYDHLADLYYSGALQAAFQAARPQVRECIEEQGGLSVIHGIVQPYVNAIVSLLQALNIQDIVHDTLISILGQDLYDQYVGPLLNVSSSQPGLTQAVTFANLQNKGFFGDVFNGISQSAQQLGSYIAGIAQNAIETLQAKIEEIKEMALAFVQNGLQTAQQLTFQAAQNLIDFLQPFKEDLGQLYNQVVDQLGAIYTGLVLPL